MGLLSQRGSSYVMKLLLYLKKNKPKQFQIHITSFYIPCLAHPVWLAFNPWLLYIFLHTVIIKKIFSTRKVLLMLHTWLRGC